VLRWDDLNDGETYTVLGYDLAIPDNLFTWQPPAGVKVVEFSGWWESRKDQRLATAASQEWNVTVHAVDNPQRPTGTPALPPRGAARPR